MWGLKVKFNLCVTITEISKETKSRFLGLKFSSGKSKMFLKLVDEMLTRLQEIGFQISIKQ